MTENPTFEVLGRPVEVPANAGNVYIISRQKITQPKGSSSEHIVINKIRRNSDGTQNGKNKQIFISVDSISEVVKAIGTLNSK